MVTEDCLLKSPGLVEETEIVVYYFDQVQCLEVQYEHSAKKIQVTLVTMLPGRGKESGEVTWNCSENNEN